MIANINFKKMTYKWKICILCFVLCFRNMSQFLMYVKILFLQHHKTLQKYDKLLNQYVDTMSGAY